MDGREGDEGSTTAERPLTRRELRAAQAAGSAAASAAGSGAGSAAASASVDDPAQGREESAGPREADSWEAAVGWALRGELPATLPPEPVEPDDVRWGPDLGEEAPRQLPPEPADDRRPWTAGSGLWDELLESGEVDEPRASDAHDGPDGSGGVGSADPAAEGQPRRVSVFGASGVATGGFGQAPGYVGLPAHGGRSTWTPTTSVPTQVGEPVVPSGAVEQGSAPHADAGGSLDARTERTELVGDLERAGLEADLELQDDRLDDRADDRVDDRADDRVDDRADEDTHERARTAPRGLPVVPALPLPPVHPTAEPAALPTLDDLMATRPAPVDGPAEWGWRAFLRRATGGLVAPEPGPAERAERAAVASVQRPLDGPRTIVVINPKGGAHKTTAALLLAATFGRLRGGYTLAWDNNETRGTLGWRSRHTHHARTAIDLLEDLERFADPSSSRVGDLDAYVRSQASAQFDVLASDEDAASAASFDAFAFRALHRTLLRFYRVLVVDTGNNMRASNWQAALEAADQVVVVSTMREDTAQSAAWMLDALRATGHEDAVRRAVTVLSQPGPRTDAELTARLHDHFGRLTRTVLEVPYEPTLVAGGPIDYEALSETTRRAWLRVAAACADGL